MRRFPMCDLWTVLRGKQPGAATCSEQSDNSSSIEHANVGLLQQPEIKITDVSPTAGFKPVCNVSWRLMLLWRHWRSDSVSFQRVSEKSKPTASDIRFVRRKLTVSNRQAVNAHSTCREFYPETYGFKRSELAPGVYCSTWWHVSGVNSRD